ncbi:MAG TPA: hypothetical protein VMZ30_12240 [Pyrinomonadaceae bacterium]|nr:hypothetical protein [Pyrinomonadaceae bacterium]
MKKTKIKPPPNWEDTPQSFERFETLAKGLMAVPKKELDKQTAKEQRKHQAHKKKSHG